LPAGTGKTVRIAVIADDDEAKAAKAAGADIAGVDAIVALLDKEQLDFDVLISTPAQMVKLGKYARLLGPRGLMPNPKSGTVTTDLAKAVAEAKAGKVEYRVDQAGIIHLGLGKVSFGAAKLAQNANAVTASIKSAKPGGIKGSYVKAAYITTTMGPSVKFDLS
jgi:large subunit ribosomal protein L1